MKELEKAAKYMQALSDFFDIEYASEQATEQLCDILKLLASRIDEETVKQVNEIIEIYETYV